MTTYKRISTWAGHYDTWEEAYSMCREADRPLLVEVVGEVGTVFPSGHYRKEPFTVAPKATQTTQHERKEAQRD